MNIDTQLRCRTDPDLLSRLEVSRQATEGVGMAVAEVPGWLAAYRREKACQVRRIRFDDLDQWSFDTSTGNLGHHSGRFFTVEGVHTVCDTGTVREWTQPIIVQPEVGILGILVRQFDGVPHFLMQAKIEPGNPNLVQLSPTVQATRSNYTKVHRGSAVRYLEYFTEPGRGQVLADALQSEHGSWFYRKANRNVLLEVTEPVPVHAGYQWFTLGQLGALMHYPNLVNMDARSVLACLPTAGEAYAVHPDAELRSWLTWERARHEVRTRRIPLRDVADWSRDDQALFHFAGRYFRIVAVAVEGGGREVTGWSQPLLEPVGLGVTAFLYRRIGGVPHLLAHARQEAGLLEGAEIGPTVQCTPVNYTHLPERQWPRFLREVLAADPDAIRYEAVHSEEGGRFLDAQSRYLIVEVDRSVVPDVPPPGFRWLTPAQLSSLVQHSRHLNVAARTLLAVLTSGAAHLT